MCGPWVVGISMVRWVSLAGAVLVSEGEILF